LRQNTPESADTISKMAGTYTSHKVTTQTEDALILGKASTGTGTVREVEEFNISPNLIKSLNTGQAAYICKGETDVLQLDYLGKPKPQTLPDIQKNERLPSKGIQKMCGYDKKPFYLFKTVEKKKEERKLRLESVVKNVKCPVCEGSIFSQGEIDKTYSCINFPNCPGTLTPDEVQKLQDAFKSSKKSKFKLKKSKKIKAATAPVPKKPAPPDDSLDKVLDDLSDFDI